mmetsp:Transcript_57994/g.115113  ORF Transcript_57994/g.115113 Transcript_57994/m.115113 type:complete len:160 (-) Transcript_57994:558-1037(-)
MHTTLDHTPPRCLCGGPSLSDCHSSDYPSAQHPCRSEGGNSVLPLAPIYPAPLHLTTFPLFPDCLHGTRCNTIMRALSVASATCSVSIAIKRGTALCQTDATAPRRTLLRASKAYRAVLPFVATEAFTPAVRAQPTTRALIRAWGMLASVSGVSILTVA